MFLITSTPPTPPILMITSTGEVRIHPDATQQELRKTLTTLAEMYHRDVLWPRQMTRRMA